MIPASYPDWRRRAHALLWEQAGRSRDLPPELPEGLEVPAIAAAAKAFMASEWQVSAETALEFLDISFPEQRREEILFAILLLTIFKRKLPAETWNALQRWTVHMTDPDVCDQLAINLVGRLVSADRHRFKVLGQWAAAPQALTQRLAILSSVAALKKEACKPKDVIRLIEPFMIASTATMQNAVVWALSQVTRLDERGVLDLLKRWKAKAHPEIFKRSSRQLSGTARLELSRER